MRRKDGNSTLPDQSTIRLEDSRSLEQVLLSRLASQRQEAIVRYLLVVLMVSLSGGVALRPRPFCRFKASIPQFSLLNSYKIKNI